MTVLKSRGFSAPQKRELWDRWRKGQSLSEIGRALGKHAGSISGVLAIRGGISPPNRTRSPVSLSLSEREEISRGISAGLSLQNVARSICRSASTISREITRNGGRELYRANKADKKAWDQAKRPKRFLLAENQLLQRLVAEKLQLDWSPQQISGWLKRQYPDDQGMQVSHETIYRSLFIQARGVLKKELVKHLRSRRVMRRSKHSTTEVLDQKTSIVDAISIRERPPEVAGRTVPGHWEGDLISGSKNSHIATLVERQSRFTMLVQVNGKDTDSVVSALCREVNRLPVELKKTLTWDRGGELGSHRKFTIATDIQVYFCDPQSPWQRGSNENTNRLLRQYFPKGTDLSGWTQQKLSTIAQHLNERLRKTLRYYSPAERLNEIIALTG